VAHAYNPSYLEGRDGEDQGLRQAKAKSLESSSQTKAGGWQSDLSGRAPA
jgi:hypothetical protein